MAWLAAHRPVQDPACAPAGAPAHPPQPVMPACRCGRCPRDPADRARRFGCEPAGKPIAQSTIAWIKLHNSRNSTSHHLPNEIKQYLTIRRGRCGLWALGVRSARGAGGPARRGCGPESRVRQPVVVDRPSCGARAPQVPAGSRVMGAGKPGRGLCAVTASGSWSGKWLARERQIRSGRSGHWCRRAFGAPHVRAGGFGIHAGGSARREARPTIPVDR